MCAFVEPSISAAVLTGGFSSRMGTDKALINVGGATILDRTVRLLRALSNDVMVIGDRDPYHASGAAVLADTYPAAGPLGGIATALDNALYQHVIVVGCDMPFLSERLLRAMAAEPRDYDALLPTTESAGGDKRWQPLHAIYSVRCLHLIAERVKLSDLRIQRVLRDMNVRELDADWLVQFDPAQRSFTNVNTPEDLQDAERLMNNLDQDAKGESIET